MSYMLETSLVLGLSMAALLSPVPASFQAYEDFHARIEADAANSLLELRDGRLAAELYRVRPRSHGVDLYCDAQGLMDLGFLKDDVLRLVKGPSA